MPIMDESDVSLPKATLSKMIRELMPSELRFGAESLDMLIECCTEFVNLLSAESNEVATREHKNTIHAEHVVKALEDLGFGEFVPEVKNAWNAWKEENKSKTSLRPKGHKTAADAAGYSEEQQIKMQQKLFAEAKARSTFTEAQTSTVGLDERYGLEGVPPTFPQLYVNTTTVVTPEHTNVSQMTPSSIYTELSARSDVLPIHPLPVPPVSSDFSPNVISAGTEMLEQPEGCDAVTAAPAETSAASLPSQPLDFRRISMSQPVIVLYNGVQHMVSWQALVSHVAMLPQFSQQQDNGEAVGDFSLQIPVATTPDNSFLQPSFPESAEGLALPPATVVTQGMLTEVPIPVEALFGSGATDVQPNATQDRD